MKVNSIIRIKKIVLIALLSAILSAGKFALIAVPNVEIVSIIVIVSAFVFGLGITLPATIIFVMIETFIWGFSPWVVSYFIYWPLLALVSFLFKRIILKNRVIFPALIGAVMTLFFGVLTTFIDTLFYSSGRGFFSVFAAMYLKGVSFFLVHVVSNSIILAVLFLPFSKTLTILEDKYYRDKKRYSKKEEETKENIEMKEENLAREPKIYGKEQTINNPEIAEESLVSGNKIYSKEENKESLEIKEEKLFIEQKKYNNNKIETTDNLDVGIKTLDNNPEKEINKQDKD